MAKTARKVAASSSVVVPEKRQSDKFRSWNESEEIKAETFSAILKRIANGETLTKVCNSSEDFPNAATFLGYVAKDPILAKQYARAMEIRADIIAETIVDIADDENNVAKARNRIEARRWHNEKLAPKKYGAKVLSENYSNINIRQKLDFTLLPADVREKLKFALMKQVTASKADD